MKLRIFSITCILLLGLCGYCPVSDYTEVSSRISGKNIPSDWSTDIPTGSASYLDGSTVLVSIFVEDPSSSWSAEDRQLVMSKMEIATDFLVTEGASYGKNVNLIYDIQEHPDLEFTVSYSKEIHDDEDSSSELLNYITGYIDAHIPTKEILDTYQVDSIGYMCYLNEDGVSYTYPFYENDSDIYQYETCFLFLRCDGEYEPPAVYAHEMLHLFGGRDLYASNEIDGVTKDFVKYIETTYPNEIMLTTYDENWNNVQDSVSNDLTDITAYFIGWLDTIPELENYPSIESEYPACFTYIEDSTGNYEEYTAGDSDNSGSSPWGAEQTESEDRDTDLSNEDSWLLRMIVRFFLRLIF